MRIGLSRYGTSDPGLKSKPSDRMVYYAGHDINIYFVRVLLGLNWLTESYNINQSPPGGLLRFELSHAASSTMSARNNTAGTEGMTGMDNNSSSKFVKIFFEAQTMGQQRRAEELHGATGNVPDRVAVAIPGCASGPEQSCPFEQFQQLVSTAVNRQCVENLGGAGKQQARADGGWPSWL